MAPLFALNFRARRSVPLYMPLVTFISWLLLVWSLGWLALPASRRIWRHADAPLLPDGGLAAGRMLLLSFWALGAFWLGHLGVPVRLSALQIYPVMLFLLWRWKRERGAMKSLVQSQKRGLIASELVFFAAFAFFFVLRSFWPSIENGEKPMDMALISACARANFLPPPNPYAAGERLASYYYLGHLQTALLTDAIGAAPRWTYNLMAATLPALCFSLLASLAGALVGRVRYGVVAAFIVLACGTEEAWRQWIVKWHEAKQSGLPFAPWPINYWDTSRVIPYVDKDGPHFTINEYPWFTFNYADLHAHYFGQPLALLILALGWALFHQVRDGAKSKPWKVTALIAALALGAQIVTNTWDFPAYSLLIFSCVASLAFWPGWKAKKEPAKAKKRPNSVDERLETASQRRIFWMRFALASVVSVAIGFVALLVASPFLLKLHSAANPPQPLEQPASPLPEWLLVWGLFTSAWVLCLTVDTVRQQRRIEIYLAVGFVSFVFCLAWFLGGLQLYVLSLLFMLIFWTWASALFSEDATHVFLCRVALCGLLALLWSETTWAGFLGKPYHRQDTVFKFGLQAWYLLGIAGTCGALRLWSRWRAAMPAEPPLRLEFARTGLALLFLAPLVALVSTPMARARMEFISRGRLESEYTTPHQPGTIKPFVLGFHWFGLRAERWDGWDGWDAWTHLAPAEHSAAQWLWDAARDGENLLEAEQKEGGDYSEFTRYTHATGIPTVIGPQAHTFQWGVDWEKVFERKNDARTFYTSGGSNKGVERTLILQKYKVRYIVCGELERSQYGLDNLARLERDLIQDGLGSVTFEDINQDPHRVTIFYRK